MFFWQTRQANHLKYFWRANERKYRNTFSRRTFLSFVPLRASSSPKPNKKSLLSLVKEYGKKCVYALTWYVWMKIWLNAFFKTCKKSGENYWYAMKFKSTHTLPISIKYAYHRGANVELVIKFTRPLAPWMHGTPIQRHTNIPVKIIQSNLKLTGAIQN